MTTATGRSAGEHVCWPFHGMDELVADARAYVADGLERREQVAFCKLTPSGSRRAIVSDVAVVGLPASADVPVLTPLATDPEWRPWWNPVDTLRPMTDAALAEGYTGLRVLTDATDLAREPGSRDEWVRSEHLIDRYSLDHPITIMCGYDVDALDAQPLAELACVHALTGGTPSPFLLHAVDGDGTLALTGEVDRSSAATLYRAVTKVAATTSGPLELDLTDLAFIDHAGLVALHRAARALGRRVHLTGASAVTALLVDAFRLTGLSLRETS